MSIKKKEKKYVCWWWISVNLEYLLYIGFDYDLQLTRH
jgi:hypothetical protein